MKTKILNKIPSNPVVIDKIMEKAKILYCKDNKYGVIGFGISNKLIKGVRNKKSFIAYIKKKIDKPEHKIEPFEIVHKGTILKIIPDVVPVGHNYAHTYSNNIIFTGIHAGGTIIVDNQYVGGICCLLSNYNNYPTHLLTSGHLFPSSNDKLKVYSGEYNSTELLHIGDLAVNLLDNYPNNPGFPIDIALVELNDNAVDLIVDNGPVINKFIPAPSILNKMAQVFFPTTNDYSNYVKIEPHFVEQYSLNSDARGWFTVRKMIKTEISITNPGDSGTILFVNQNLGAGVCTGGALGLFEPLDRALQAISEIENTAYYIWR